MYCENQGSNMSEDIKFEGQEPKRPMRIGTLQTINAETGEVVSERPNAMTILPPRSGCPECGTEHDHDQPHNQQSLTYQYQFHATHGRWPTWTDAMAHCTDEVKAAWRPLLIQQMKVNGMTVPADLLEEKPVGR